MVKKIFAAVQMAGDCPVFYLKSLPKSRMRLRLAAVAADPKPLIEETDKDDENFEENDEDSEENTEETPAVLTKQPENGILSGQYSAEEADQDTAVFWQIRQEPVVPPSAVGASRAGAETPIAGTVPAPARRQIMRTNPPAAALPRRPTTDDLRAASRGTPEVRPAAPVEISTDDDHDRQGCDDVPQHHCRRGLCFAFGLAVGLAVGLCIGLAMQGVDDFVVIEPAAEEPVMGIGDEEPTAALPVEPPPVAEPIAAQTPMVWICDRPGNEPQYISGSETEGSLTMSCGATTWRCGFKPAGQEITKADCTQLQ